VINLLKQVVFARMSEKDVELVKRICNARGEDLSDFVRRAIRTELGRLSYLSEDEKKALGIKTHNEVGENDDG